VLNSKYLPPCPIQTRAFSDQVKSACKSPEKFNEILKDVFSEPLFMEFLRADRSVTDRDETGETFLHKVARHGADLLLAFVLKVLQITEIG
jgi:hypothetical protein